MKPAILYGEDITCYVVWAVTRDGQIYNLGELLASSPKGSRKFTTANKNFALLVTLEPIGLVREPSAYPAFKSVAIADKQIKSLAFRFDNFRDLTPRRAVDTIQDLAWDDDTPIELLQARKAYEIAGRLGAGRFAPSFYRQSSEALSAANVKYAEKPKDRQVIDLARRSVTMSFEAVNVSWAREETLLVEAELAARRAEMAAIAAEIRTTREQAEESRKQAQALNRQRTRLAKLLRSSMNEVAATRETAEGIVVSLPDILFDVNESTLKHDAEVALAKLAGILLVMNDFQIRVEGYTDASGKPEYNQKLSEKRAVAVLEFMTGEGIMDQRMSSVGFGIAKPIADNANEDGRKKNRRVEIVLSEG